MSSIQPQHNENTSRPRVLVVDDSTTARHIVSAALAGSYEIQQASDGLEALFHLQSTSDFVCVVTDDNMPGCSGIEVAEFVRSTPSLSHVPVIIVAAGSSSPTARQVDGHRARAAVLINKPFFAPHLLRLVNMLNRGLQREEACA